MLGGRAKDIKLPNFLPKVDNVQRDKYSSQINLKDSVRNAKLQPAQVESVEGSPQPRENALKGSADYSALIQKALWFETRTQHLLRKYFTRTT